MSNKLFHQKWFWYKIIEFNSDWINILNYRCLNSEIKKYIYHLFINLKVVKPISLRRFIKINKCSNCGKVIDKCHMLHYNELNFPVRILILCNNWKCRYAGLLTYHYEFTEQNKYLLYKNLHH